MATALRNRRGRKRKSRARTPSGQLVKLPPPDFRAMAALQPHRIGLPEAVRASELGATYLTRLQATKRISGQMREAGERYAFLVSAYYATLPLPQRPHGVLDTGSSGPGYDCTDCTAQNCECLERHKRYARAYEALARAGRPATMAVNDAAVRNSPVADIEVLARGLGALARYFGLR
jgi:hypothetical protein